MGIGVFVPLIIVIPLASFWFVMFKDFASNHEIPPDAKNIWLIAFIFLNIPTAIYYYFTVYQDK